MNKKIFSITTYTTAIKATACSLVKKKSYWVVLSAIVLASTLIVLNWQAITIWYSMVPQTRALPAFDTSKAKQLSAQRRADLERELFSELWMWDRWSRRYQAPDGLAERRQRWVEMAQEGYELAYLTLQVLEPDEHVHNPLPVLKRLDELASQGDTGAMCLYGGIAFQLPIWAVDWAPQHKRARMWMEKGAELGHPQCLSAVGRRLIAGTEGYPKEVKRGSEMLFDAIRRGYVQGSGAFRVYFVDAGLEKADNRRLEYCWGYQTAKYTLNDADLTLMVNARTNASGEKRLALERELNEFRQWHPTSEDCIQLTRNTFGE